MNLSAGDIGVHHNETLERDLEWQRGGRKLPNVRNLPPLRIPEVSGFTIMKNEPGADRRRGVEKCQMAFFYPLFTPSPSLASISFCPETCPLLDKKIVSSIGYLTVEYQPQSSYTGVEKGQMALFYPLFAPLSSLRFYLPGHGHLGANAIVTLTAPIR
jgi:hypothetical protein